SHDGLARDLVVGAFLPGNVQGFERLVGLPPRVGDDSYCGIPDLHDVADAGHRLGLGLVVTLDLGAEHGRLHDRGVEHAGQLDVDGVDLLACELFDGVEALHALAGDLPVLRVLQLDVLGIGRRQLGRSGSYLAVGDRAARLGVGDDAVG